MGNSGAPAWITGLLAVFAVAVAVTFGLLVYRHAEATNLVNQHNWLKNARLEQLRIQHAALKDQIPKLDAMIRDRREKVATLDETEKTWTGDLDRLVQDNKARLGETAELSRKEVKGYSELMKEAPERRAEVGKEEERSFSQEHDFDENRRKLRDEIEQASQALEQARKKGRSELLALDARVAELENRVRFLTNQLDIENREMRSDGQVLAAASAASGFVVIDRGRKHNLRRNTVFTVFNVRGGVAVPKGLIEVISMEERISTCRVLKEVDRNNPFIDGDYIHNPVWDADKVKSFAIRGDFQRFSRDEIKRFIEASGGRVDSDLKVGTDYLVAGGRAEQATDTATKLGVAILSEDQLLDFIRPQE
jgi:NAD-dependent DNA ligase